VARRDPTGANPAGANPAGMSIKEQIELRRGTVEPPNGANAISDLAARDDRLVCVRDQAALVRDGDGPWRAIAV
jgi:hypothetical protein